MISIASDQQQADRVFAALSDATRRRIIELLAQEPLTAGELHRGFPIAAPAVSRHLRVLREAGLVRVERVPGDERVRLYALEPAGLDVVANWRAELERHWQRQLESFKDYVALRAGRGEAGQVNSR